MVLYKVTTVVRWCYIKYTTYGCVSDSKIFGAFYVSIVKFRIVDVPKNIILIFERKKKI
jgi:hypothetical protein